MNKYKWVFKHTEDDYAVLRHEGLDGVVHHDGAMYTWMLMTEDNYREMLNGCKFFVLAEGREFNHSNAMEMVEDCLE